MRPGRGDITTMRVDRNTASGIEWVTKITVLSVFAQSSQELLVEVVADDLVERAERLVHEQQLGLDGERAGDRDALLHAAGKLPRELALEAGEVDQREIRARRVCRRSARRQPHDLERQGDVPVDRPPGIERGGLEDVAVGALLAAPPRR